MNNLKFSHQNKIICRFNMLLNLQTADALPEHVT